MTRRAAAMREAFMDESVTVAQAKQGLTRWVRRNGRWKIRAYINQNNIIGFNHALVGQRHRDRDAELTAETLQRIANINAATTKVQLANIFDSFSTEFER